MCEPTLILSLASGTMSAVTGIQEQNRQHAARVAHVNRQNAIAQQDYLNKTTIAAHNDQQKLRVYQDQLDGAAAEKEAYYKQIEMNQLERDRASEAAQMELNEKIDEAELKGQKALAESIRAQGTVLAGNTAGQSMLLESMEAERVLGMEIAELDHSLWNAEQAFTMKEYSNDLSKYAGDMQATRGIKGGPNRAPTASFQTIKPTMIEPPKKPSSLGPILGGITAGFSTYIGSAGFRGGGSSLGSTGGSFKGLPSSGYTGTGSSNFMSGVNNWKPLTGGS